MSSNKNKYFVVTTTTVVSATSKTEAEKAVRLARAGRPSTSARVLWQDAAIDRVPAAQAHSLTATS